MSETKPYRTLSASGLDTLQSCWAKYNFSYNEKLTLPEKSNYLDRGSLFHTALEAYYKGLMKGEVDYAQLVKGIEDELPPAAISLNLSSEEIRQIQRIFRLYAVHYMNENWKPVAVEQPFSVPLYETDRAIYLLEGKVDLMFRLPDGTLLPTDHKTTSKQEQYKPITNQILAYNFATGINQLVINEIGFQKDPIFRRITLLNQPDVVQEWVEEVAYWIRMLEFHEGAGVYPRSHSGCKFCDYSVLCASSPSAREFKATTFFKKKEAHDIFKGTQPTPLPSGSEGNSGSMPESNGNADSKGEGKSQEGYPTIGRA